MAINVFGVNGEIPASVARSLVVGGTMAPAPTGILPRSAVLTGPAAWLQVAAAGGWTLTIQPGHAVVAGYRVVVDAVTAVAVDPSTTTARWDMVGIRVLDMESADATSEAVIEVVKGSTTADPPLPPRFLPLARIIVGASVSSITSGDVTDLRGARTAASGGLVPIPGAAAGTPTAAGVAPGQMVWDESANGGAGLVLLARTATTWKLVTPASGVFTGTVNSTTAILTIPHGLPAVPTWATVIGSGNLTSDRLANYRCEVSGANLLVRVARIDTGAAYLDAGTVNVRWIAG